MARVLKQSHSFTCTPRVHPLTERTIPAFAFPAEAGKATATDQQRLYRVAFIVLNNERLNRLNTSLSTSSNVNILLLQHYIHCKAFLALFKLQLMGRNITLVNEEQPVKKPV